MQVPIVTKAGNIVVGKTTLLQKFKESLSGEDKVTIKIEHNTVKELKSFMEMISYIHQTTLTRVPQTMPLSSKIMY